jgi:hypothetical protein
MKQKATMTDAAGCRAAWALRMAGKSDAEIAVRLELGNKRRVRKMVAQGAILVMDDLCWTRKKTRNPD